jgi:elongator complex protein 3
MPKSYIANEPGAQRAGQNGFDPYLQVYNRLDAYRQIGHPISKVELIVLGGTWSVYPESYQIWFIKRLFDALNDFGSGNDNRPRTTAINLKIKSHPTKPTTSILPPKQTTIRRGTGKYLVKTVG